MEFWQSLSTPVLVALIYGALINVFTLVLFGLDKSRSLSGAWRVPERVLLICTFFGGSVGALVGIKLFRHKTRKVDFLLPLVLIIVLQLAVVGYVLYKNQTASLGENVIPLYNY